MSGTMTRLIAIPLVAGCAKESAPPAPREEPAPAAAPAAPVVREPDELRHVHLKALKMECASCLRKVERVLARLDGVYQIGFDLSDDSIFVSYDARLGEPAPATRPMLALIEEAGFEPAWLKAEAWPDGVQARVVAR